MNDWSPAKYLNISTQKRDGSWVNTPVWFVLDNKIIYLFSEGTAGKVKRIRNFPDVKICPCNILGKLTGEWENAKAIVVIDESAQKQAHSALLKKYGWQMQLLDLGAGLAGKKDKRAFIQVTISK